MRNSIKRVDALLPNIIVNTLLLLLLNAKANQLIDPLFSFCNGISGK